MSFFFFFFFGSGEEWEVPEVKCLKPNTCFFLNFVPEIPFLTYRKGIFNTAHNQHI